MRKLPSSLENPIDNFIYIGVEYLSPIVYKMGLTPNIITTLGNIFTVLFVVFFLKKQYELSALSFLVSYYFDCLDGYVARSYNMVTVFGDYYDHISDSIKMLLFLYLISRNSKSSIFYIVLLILLLLMFINLAHQELYYGNPSSSQTLSLLSFFSIANTKEEAEYYMNYTKYFGCGTLIATMTLIILFYKKL